MTKILVRYQMKQTHEIRDAIDKAGLSWKHLTTKINVYKSETNAEMLNVDIQIKMRSYLDAMKKHEELIAHFERHDVPLRKKIILQSFKITKQKEAGSSRSFFMPKIVRVQIVCVQIVRIRIK